VVIAIVVVVPKRIGDEPNRIVIGFAELIQSVIEVKRLDVFVEVATN